jgi:hypothetical protein
MIKIKLYLLKNKLNHYIQKLIIYIKIKLIYNRKKKLNNLNIYQKCNNHNKYIKIKLKIYRKNGHKKMSKNTII